MRDRSQYVLVVLTLVGMIGLYVGLWLAYRKYQQYQATLARRGTVGGLLSILQGGA